MFRSATPSVHATSTNLRAFLQAPSAGAHLFTTTAKPSSTKPKRRPVLDAAEPSSRKTFSPSIYEDVRPKSPETRGHRLTLTKRARTAAEQPQLNAYTLSLRLERMVAAGQLDGAIEHLQDMPLDAQNVPVWNTLIRLSLCAERYQLGFRLYNDMKRRGFVPNLRTYTTMLGHFTTVKDWDARTKLLHQVNRLHDNYLEYATKIKKDDPKSSELSTAPTRGYLRILSSAGQYQQLFDVFNAMDEEGPLAPDLTVHGAMLRAVCTRSPTSTSTPDAARAENAARAKLVWRQLLKYVERTPSARVDSYHIREMLFALSHGSPSDQIFAFDLVRDYLGLAKPGETPKEPIVQLEAHTFEEVLKLCNNSQKYRLTIHFFQQVSGSLEPTEKSIINWRHVEAVLNAHAALAMMTNDDGEASQALDTLLWVLKQWAVEGRPDRLQPTRDHFNYVLSCCQRSGNWAIAAHTFEVFTGYRAADFADGGADASGEQPHRDLPSGRPAETTMFFLSDLARTAYLSGDLAHMRHCLRIIRFIDPQWYYPHKEHSHHDDRIMMRNFVSLNDRRFYATRMAEDVVAMIDKVVSAVSEQERHTKEEDWSRTRQKAKLVVREARASTDTVTTPFLAMNPLGGERSLAATDSFVEYDMTVRRNASSRSTKR